MCFSTTPGTPYGSASEWFGVLRRASWKIAGVIWPISIGTEEVGAGRTWPGQGNGAPGGNVGSGERVVVSICVSCVNASDGVVRRRLDFSSRKMERSVGSVGLSVDPSEVRRMNLRATLDCFYKHAKKCLAIFQAAEVACVVDEEAGCLPKSFEAVLRCL